MLEQFTTLITSGCSFTAGDGKWPQYVSEYLNLNSINYGQAAAGNSFINRSAIYAVNEFLKTSNPKELLVGIMWSGFSRVENFHNDKTKYEKQINYNFTESGTWVKIDYYNINWYSSSYFKHYFDNIGCYISTLEHILRTQWFLKNNNIKYFMTCYSNNVLPNEEEKNNPNINYLYNMIDWNNFLPVDNCMDWCDANRDNSLCDNQTIELWKKHPNNFLKMRASHPTTAQQKSFAEQVIVPYIKKTYSNEEKSNVI